MHDETQAGEPPEANGDGATPEASLVAASAAPARAERRARLTLAILTAASRLSLPIGQQEAGLAFAFAALFAVMHGADASPRWSSGAMIVCSAFALGGALGLLGLAVLAATLSLTATERLASQAVAVAGAAVVLGTLVPAARAALARRLFRGGEATHVRQLSAQAIATLLFLSLSGWIAARPLMQALLEDPEQLVNSVRLLGGLVGYVTLAVVGVGAWIVRDRAATFARLGLARPTARDGVAVAVGLAAMFALVQLVERVQRAYFPRLWEQDQSFVDSVSHAIGPEQAIVLGLSAGIGEELTLRGALQPRFGIVATAALFAILHVQYSWIGILAVFLIGVLFGIVRRATSTTAAIGIHVLYDAIVVASTALGRDAQP